MPEFDTVSTVRVDNMLRANDVVQLLLSKFRIENDPKGDFVWMNGNFCYLFHWLIEWSLGDPSFRSLFPQKWRQNIILR